MLAAAVQLETLRGDLARGLDSHLGLIADARAQGVDLLVFPELSLTGHGGGDQALALARRQDDDMLRTLAEASGPMHTVFGFIEEGEPGMFYNSMATVGGGRLRHVHRKQNLATYGQLEEGKHYARGGMPQAFDLCPDWKMATPICADLWNPALVHDLACQGAGVLAAPISSAREAVGEGFDNPAGWSVNLQFYAMTYGCYVVMANRSGAEGDLTFWGGSRILDPMGRTLAVAQGAHSQLVCAPLAREQIRRARFLLPTVRDARATGWGSR
ncbi:nitrilase-related carbon-nitrogen hydrolase [Achromobacter sp. NPDC058515]|uniref:nitrilase-related carbon-nitrogen hydrolase n=1 Tax=Achromobacter sp. NPDC058515 TaxID=3346533 RepID=UPI003650D25B